MRYAMYIAISYVSSVRSVRARDVSRILSMNRLFNRVHVTSRALSPESSL